MDLNLPLKYLKRARNEGYMSAALKIAIFIYSVEDLQFEN